MISPDADAEKDLEAILKRRGLLRYISWYIGLIRNLYWRYTINNNLLCIYLKQNTLSKINRVCHRQETAACYSERHSSGTSTLQNSSGSMSTLDEDITSSVSRDNELKRKIANPEAVAVAAAGQPQKKARLPPLRWTTTELYKLEELVKIHG